jgi:uncharacterized RDD family membrane protein YckC
MTALPGSDAPDGAVNTPAPTPPAPPAPYGLQTQGPPAGYAPAVPYSPVPGGHTLASPWLRLGALLLNCVLILVTLGIGYLIWAMVLWSDGTNPGKKMLGMRIVSSRDGQTLTWGGMFVRNFLLGGIVIGLLNAVSFGIVALVDALMIFGGTRQRLTDKMAGSLVVMK